MFRTRSPQFRIWFVLALGAATPTLLMLVGRPVETFFTLNTLLEAVRAAIGGSLAGLIALHVEKPRAIGTRTREDDPSVPGGVIQDRRRLDVDEEPPRY